LFVSQYLLPTHTHTTHTTHTHKHTHTQTHTRIHTHKHTHNTHTHNTHTHNTHTHNTHTHNTHTHNTHTHNTHTHIKIWCILSSPPDQRYIIAADASEHTQREIINAVSRSVGNSKVLILNIH